MDDGRLVRGCNVENASYGLTLCAECGLVSDLAASGGGAWWPWRWRATGARWPLRRAASSCTSTAGRPAARRRVRTRALGELLPAAFGPEDVRRARAGEPPRGRRHPRQARRARAEDAQIHWFIEGYICGEVAPEQASALLMAIKGMTPRELDSWTDAMIRSGTRLDLHRPLPTVDKHSTGGVGDKVQLPLCPLAAACGAAVPQLSGRGLGHTGGTLDKLEAILGLELDLAAAGGRRQLQDVGAVICAAGEDLAPADRELYAPRDVTATVESIPLIASSIMSKKIAEGTAAPVLDVKVGGGVHARPAPRPRARPHDGRHRRGQRRAHRGAPHRHGRPLGRAVGNALEVREALEVLEGGGRPTWSR